jgi:hypothetical protein
MDNLTTAGNNRFAAMLADGTTVDRCTISANIGRTGPGQHLLLSSSFMNLWLRLPFLIIKIPAQQQAANVVRHFNEAFRLDYCK